MNFQSYLRTTVGAVLFIVVLSMGLFISAASIDRTTLIGYPMMILTATTTNIGILCISAAFVGDVLGSPVQAIRRGFAIWLSGISGSMLVFTDAMLNPTQEQYIRLAATLGLLSFMLSMRPEKFDEFLGKVPLPGFKEKREELEKKKEETKLATEIKIEEVKQEIAGSKFDTLKQYEGYGAGA